MTVETISPDALLEAHASGANIVLIDVRTPAEFREIHVPFARNIPLDHLAAANFTNGQEDTDTPRYVICHSGTRAAKACESLTNVGYRNVVSVVGGTKAWEAAGLPVVRGKATISLERQVRIVAGALVLIGTTAGYFVHPIFLALSAFVGVGVTYAGATGSCAMGLLLARMPWNQVDTTATGSADWADQPATNCGNSPAPILVSPRLAS